MTSEQGKEVLEAEQKNEQGKRLETELDTEEKNELDLTELEDEENDEQENKLDLNELEHGVNAEQL